MKAMLMILFLTGTGNVEIINGWYPRPQPSMEVCQERKNNWTAYADKYLIPFKDNVREDVVGYIAYCRVVNG